MLLLDHRFAALDALPAVVESLFVAGDDGAQVDGRAQQAERRRSAGTLGPVLLRAAPAFTLGTPGVALFADEVLGGDAGVLEHQFGVGEQPAAELVVVAADGEARRVGGHQDHAHAGGDGALLVGPHVEEVELGGARRWR